MENQNQNVSENAAAGAAPTQGAVRPNPVISDPRISFNEAPVQQPIVQQQPPMSPIEQNTAPLAVPQIKYAGFWVRYVANIIDCLILGIPGVIITVIMGALLPSVVAENDNVAMQILFSLPVYLFVWLYFIVMTYKYQATLGKKAVGIKVLSDKAENLTIGQLILRETIGKILSYTTLWIGYIMAGFTQRKQALHDKIASTVVIHNDPNGKIAWWAIALACVLPAIAIVGILASIVLVSLSTARDIAADESTKANLATQIPAAMIYADDKGSFKGFIPDFSKTKLLPCVGDAITNISPDGKSMAILAKLCRAKGKYFCADTNNDSREVDEQYAKSGAATCNKNESQKVDKVTDNDNRNKDDYQKILAALGESNGAQLKSITLDLLSSEQNAVGYIFVIGDKVVYVQYDLDSGTAQKMEEINMREAMNDKNIKQVVSNKTIPNEIVSRGIKGAKNTLEEYMEYQKYLEKNPDVFTKYIATVGYDEKYGWEWRFIFANKVENNGRKAISFAINPERNKVVVLSKTNMTE